MTIDELAVEYNQSNDDNTHYEDKRLSEEVTPRRIRDYVSKGLVPKPLKEGRNAYYTEEHLEELKNIRELQSKGFTESYLQKNYTPENQFKTNAENALRSILDEKTQAQNLNNNNEMLFGGNAEQWADQFLKKNRNVIKKEIQHKWKINNQIEISINGDTKLTEQSIEEILLQIKKILKENYHDKL